MAKVSQISVSHSRSSAEQFGSTVTTVLLDDGRIFQSFNDESWSQLRDGPWMAKQPADPVAHLRALKPGWNSDSLVPSEAALRVAAEILRTPWSAGPTASGGGVQIETHCGGIDHEFVIRADGTIEDYEADPPADREQDDEPLDTPEFTAALEADHAKWLAGRAARREQVRREMLEPIFATIRKSINDCFGGMGSGSAIWSNNIWDKGHTAGVLSALTAFDTRLAAELRASRIREGAGNDKRWAISTICDTTQTKRPHVGDEQSGSFWLSQGIQRLGHLLARDWNSRNF